MFQALPIMPFDYLKVSDHLIPINERSEVLVPYRGREGSFPYISAIDVIDGSADLSALNDRIIIIGTSAKALFDLRATPVQEDYPGVEVHANLIAGILDGRLKERPYYVLGAEIVLLLLGGFVHGPVPAKFKSSYCRHRDVCHCHGVIVVELSRLAVFPYRHCLSLRDYC